MDPSIIADMQEIARALGITMFDARAAVISLFVFRFAAMPMAKKATSIPHFSEKLIAFGMVAVLNVAMIVAQGGPHQGMRQIAFSALGTVAAMIFYDWKKKGALARPDVPTIPAREDPPQPWGLSPPR